MYLLYNHYSYIEIYKPTTSRLSNSEKYIICSEFKGINESFQELMNQSFKDTDNFRIDVPESFIKEVIEYNHKFVNEQIDTIKNIIKNIGRYKQIYPTQQQITNAKKWCQSYNLPINQDCIYLK